jgi:hypothetical protein
MKQIIFYNGGVRKKFSKYNSKLETTLIRNIYV